VAYVLHAAGPDWPRIVVTIPMKEVTRLPKDVFSKTVDGVVVVDTTIAFPNSATAASLQLKTE